MKPIGVGGEYNGCETCERFGICICFYRTRGSVSRIFRLLKAIPKSKMLLREFAGPLKHPKARSRSTVSTTVAAGA